MLKVILTRGCPASGKSTWAKNKVNESNGSYKRVNRDDLRAMLDPDGKGSYNYSKSNEKFVTVAQDALILKALESGRHVIVDDTNFGTKVYDRIKALVKGLNVKIEINDSFIDVPLDELIRRDNARANGVGKDVIMKFYNKYLKPKAPASIPYNIDLPDAIICDLDGTMSLMTNRSPYEWKKCIDDDVNLPVSHLVKLERSHGTKIIFFSGRSDIAKEETEQWLKAYGQGEYEMLHMRKDDDFRKDDIVKKEFYENFAKGKYNIKYVLDDRDQVVKLWRSLGLPCFQVNFGDF